MWKNRALLSAGLMIVCVALLSVSMTWSSLAAPPAATATGTLTPTLTPALLQNSPLTRLNNQLFFGGASGGPTGLTAVLKTLQRELAFGYGGGPGDPLFFSCLSALKNYNGPKPVIFLGERHYQMATLCISGMPIKNTLTIALTGPDKRKMGSAVFQVVERYQDHNLGIGQQTRADLAQISPKKIEFAGELYETAKDTLIALEAWLPPDAPPGIWGAGAKSDLQGSLSLASGAFPVIWPKNLPAIFSPAKALDPFNRPPTYTVASTDSAFYALTRSTPLQLVGINLTPNQNIPIGVYKLYLDRDAQLIWSSKQYTDPLGKFNTTLSLEMTDPPGYYHLAAILDLDATGGGEAGPFLGFYANTCPGALDSQVQLGDTIQLASENPSPNRIRSQPGLQGREIGKLEPGQNAQIIDGIICLDQMVWWKVTTSTGIEGWTAEGQGSQRFIVPVR